MGKLIYSMNVSLDGFIETPDHSLDWADVDEELHFWFNERSRQSGASIYGRRMYEVMTAYWPSAGTDPNATPAMREFGEIWNALPKVVFSRTLDAVDYGCRLVKGDVGEELAKLRSEFDGEIDVSGPNIASQFIERGLVDEYRLVVHPVILGAGTPFFPALKTPIKLRQTGEKRFGSGVLALTYEAAG
jgi:dihydrofolate reductase